MSTDVDLIRKLNDAVEARDMGAVAERFHPDIIWEHNIGVGSLEEGVYRGRESVMRLLERILEPWESLRAEQHEIRELGGGRYQIRGDLHAKHLTSDTELVAPYEQRFEIRDGLLVKGQMTNDPRRGAEARPSGESENVAIVRRWAEAFNRSDFDSALRDLAPDIELHEWPEAPGAQAYRGHDGVRHALDSWFESWEWMQVEIVDLLEVGDHVLVTLQQRAKGRGSAVEVEIQTFNVYTFRDRKVSRLELFTEREPALEAAGLARDKGGDRR